MIRSTVQHVRLTTTNLPAMVGWYAADIRHGARPLPDAYRDTGRLAVDCCLEQQQ